MKHFKIFQHVLIFFFNIVWFACVMFMLDNYSNIFFICTEMLYYFKGPKPNTIFDFWKMVWQENVYVIVMVTNLKEGRKVRRKFDGSTI